MDSVAEAVGLLLVIAAILGAIALGAALERRMGERAELLANRLLKWVLFVVLPAVVFFNVVGIEVTVDLLGGVALAWVALLTAGLLVYLVGRARWTRPATGTVIVCALAANTGYLGYPMTAVFLGTDRISEAVTYDILVAVPILIVVCFAVGAAFGTEAGEGAGARARSFALRNPLLPAFALALLAPESLAPDALVSLSQALVFAALPVGFVAVGVNLAATSRGAFGIPRLGEEIAVGVAARLVIAPVLLLALSAPLIDLPMTYLLLAAMPAGLNSLVVTNAFGLDRRLAAGMIAWSTSAVLVAALVVSLAGA